MSEFTPNMTNGAAVDWDNVNWKPRFFILWAGQSLSLIGSALTQFILIWWITETTGSATALSIAGIMALLPQALFGPLGGTLADRWNRRIIMMVSDTVTALCIIILGLLFATETVQLWHVYTLMFVRSMMQAFQNPAAIATTSMMVPPSWLSRVAGMNQTVQGMMSVAAAPLGALALSLLPLQTALMIDVVTAMTAVIPLFFLAIPQIVRTDRQQTSAWQDFRFGIRFVLGNRGLMWLYGLTALMVAIVLPALVLTPLLVHGEFGGGVNEVALMEGIGGIGMVLGGIIVSVIALPRRQIPFILLAYAASCITIALAGAMPSNLFTAALFFWFISGVTYTAGNAPVISIIQRLIPNELQGRVLSLLSTLIGLASPVGLTLAAPLGEALGVRAVLIIGGILSTVVCLAGFFSPSLMNLEKMPPAATRLPEPAETA